jgi:Flp pilus assembly protein TadG
MTKPMHRLFLDRRGISAVEFALLAPVLFAFIIGLSQIGVLFNAQAGLRHAVQEGARYATLYVPNNTGTRQRPTDQQIIDKISASKYGLVSANITGPTITTGTTTVTTAAVAATNTSAGTYTTAYLDITMSYAVPLDFVFYHPAAITLTETRRVYVQS